MCVHLSSATVNLVLRTSTREGTFLSHIISNGHNLMSNQPIISNENHDYLKLRGIFLVLDSRVFLLEVNILRYNFFGLPLTKDLIVGISD